MTQAYRLKSVKYLSRDCKILLQNENGPCPLLAAANALLLRGRMVLPPRCVDTGIATIDDVVNVLAEIALSRTTADTENTYHLDQVMKLFPTLQYGLDVNPKFANGPKGVEYTSGLTAFEVLGVDLVHGWLLDPQDLQTANLVQQKTYNELVECVVRGEDAARQAEQIAQQIEKQQHQLKILQEADQEQENKNAQQQQEQQEQESALPRRVARRRSSNGSTSSSSFYPTGPMIESSMRQSQCEEEISALREKYQRLSKEATDGKIIHDFLQSTGHQLTHFGLVELYNHLDNDELCVFFRNNHYSTLTKHCGVLYMLVTDLGYANVPQVMWEKLDAIDGNTEYVNCQFTCPAPQQELIPPPPVMSPELALRRQQGQQPGQSERDLQLALELSRNDMGVTIPPPDGTSVANTTATTSPTTTTQASPTNLEEEESKAMRVAMESSLLEFNGLPAPAHDTQNAAPVQTPAASATSRYQRSLTDTADDAARPTEPPKRQEIQQQKNSTMNNGDMLMSELRQQQENYDHQVAMELQAQANSSASEALAIRLQTQAYQQQPQRQEQQTGGIRQKRGGRRKKGRQQGEGAGSTATSSNCVIS